jgi:SAM-dependent methyltransferase
MSDHDDEAAKLTTRRPSIPAPATVPRPSRPPISVPPPGASGPESDRKGRKGTLGGVPPAPAAPTGLGATPATGAPAFAETTAEDFDAEKTMVVDPDDAPTADYDPRTAGSPYDPRARGTFSSQDAPVPQPRASDAGKRRTSRRTVKIPDDNARKKEAIPDVPVVDAPPAAGTAPAPSPSQPERAPDPVLAERAEEFNDELTDEITVVKPLRIISVGSDPPPPIRSALATWPPPPAPQALEAGWTPMAPPVASSAAPATVPEPRRHAEAPAPIVAEEVEPPTPLAPPVVEEAELDGDSLEEIEPDAAAIPPPKKPPPPPPKTRDASRESKPAIDGKPAEDTTPKKRPWWDDIFSDEYLRTHDRLDEPAVKREVDFIEESLGVERHAVVLDLGCGSGDHAIELAARGYSVVGLDYSAGQLAAADKALKARQASQPGSNAPSFVKGDMRELTYEEAFDGAYIWSTTFGYFDDEKNLSVLASLHKALRQGGMLLIDVVNRDYVAPRSPSLVWFEGRQCVCMDDMFVDYFTSRLRVKRTAMFEGGLSRELEYSIRLYSLHEVGFKVVEVTGHPAHPGVFFGTESPRLIVLAERS